VYNRAVDTPPALQDVLLADAVRRDRTTARRVSLVKILFHERHLTRAQLLARVELELGKNCFGESAWEDTFYRDMLVVKQALSAAGFSLAYGRSRAQPGYYLRGQPAISPELAKVLDGCISEVDLSQSDILGQLSFAQRFQQGCSVTNLACQVVAHRLRVEHPRLSLQEAQQAAIQRSYSRA
jgi:hypothetical protein